jgi:hypothetical protein
MSSNVWTLLAIAETLAAGTGDTEIEYNSGHDREHVSIACMLAV